MTGSFYDSTGGTLRVMEVQLTSDQKAFARRAIDSGRLQTEQEAVEEALADLDDIWYYVAKESGSSDIANRLIDTITDRFFLLAGFPYLGRSRDEDFGVGCRTSP